MADGQWFRVGYVETSGEDRLALQGPNERICIDGLASADVHKDASLFHFLESIIAKHLLGFLGQRYTTDHKIALLQEAVQAYEFSAKSVAYEAKLKFWFIVLCIQAVHFGILYNTYRLSFWNGRCRGTS